MKAYRLARNALFALDAERSHELTMAWLSRHPASGGLLSGKTVEDPVRLMGLSFRNRVGLAAGLDKNGEAIEAFDRMGFGFIEVGTVTPRPQRGNDRPRMFRIPSEKALINRLGFNNQGVDALVKRAACVRRHAVLGINIGKNADTPIEQAELDYLACLHKVYAVADYITVNISSPNTKNLRDLQQASRFDSLLATLADARETLTARYGARRPILVKIAPDIDDDALIGLADAARRHGIDGLIATNTTVARDAVAGLPHAHETGGLSGAPLLKAANTIVAKLRERVGPDFPLIGVGGIQSGADAASKRAAGADLVQLYTGLIYRGPGLVSECARALRDLEHEARTVNLRTVA
ncbi:quinone-dependent dihydroorotate dehydrogenase [Nevskia sp.]|uniref:quinone-dependent dihydroorotate dehydrogenase n=1 Tax=Nevskia sp. TaxID=1929292 RepID=UPI0025F3630B|nr:quinone-dependent dihydroorotate dehydrogenase [Nevskia sp.]